MTLQVAPFFVDFTFLKRLKVYNKSACHQCKIEFIPGEKIRAIGKNEYRKYYHMNCYVEY